MHSSKLSSIIFTGVAMATLFVWTIAEAAPLPFSKAPFTDVPVTHPYYEGIEYFRRLNVIKGYLDGGFHPSTRINRAEVAQLITNPRFLKNQGQNDCLQSEALQDRDTVYFPDVHKDAWYALPVCIARTRDLIDGYPDGTFQPNDPIIFAEVAKIIVNTFVSDFKASQSDEHWYDSYVEYLADLNAIPASIKSANQVVTRGEVVQMIFLTQLNGAIQSGGSIGNLY